MGEPLLHPFSTAWRQRQGQEQEQGQLASIHSFPLQLVHQEYMVTDISMGNPHAVVFVDDLDSFLPAAFLDEGPRLSASHEVFPDGANAEFAQVSLS
jgi:diaminopimelate epimerase